ncbi:hypothetical protein LGW58_09975, partial [Streptococcus mutans]|nr:hypothetical protein [Streptococcus mutans]
KTKKIKDSPSESRPAPKPRLKVEKEPESLKMASQISTKAEVKELNPILNVTTILDNYYNIPRFIMENKCSIFSRKINSSLNLLALISYQRLEINYSIQQC